MKRIVAQHRHTRGVAGILLLSLGVAALSSMAFSAQVPELRPDPREYVPSLERHEPASRLCVRDDLPMGIRLDGAAVDSIGRAFSRHNTEVVQRADSLYRAGYFGRIGEDESKTRAINFVQLRCWNAMHYLANLSTDTRGVSWVDDPDELPGFSDRYRNLAIYPLRFIQRARIGAQAFCAQYDIPKDFDERIPYGEDRVRLRHQRKDLPGLGKVDMVSREHKPEPGKTLELLFSTEDFSGDVLVERIVDRGDTLNLVSLANIEGLYVHKSGLHKLTAIVVWWNHVEGLQEPANVRIGGCAYFPSIKFSLPSFLPDLGLADLRDFAFPPPIFAGELFRNPQTVFPSWLETHSNGQFRGWESFGPRPELVEHRFPDL